MLGRYLLLLPGAIWLVPPTCTLPGFLVSVFGLSGLPIAIC